MLQVDNSEVKHHTSPADRSPIKAVEGEAPSRVIQLGLGLGLLGSEMIDQKPSA